MRKKEFVDQLKEALEAGLLMTPKHDPSNLGRVKYSSYRSVLSYELAKNLEEFIGSENFDVVEYENTNPKHKKELFEIIPKDIMFSVPASGVGPDSLKPTEALDRLIAVWNAGGRPHIFGESSKELQEKEDAGKLVKKANLE